MEVKVKGRIKKVEILSSRSPCLVFPPLISCLPQLFFSFLSRYFFGDLWTYCTLLRHAATARSGLITMWSITFTNFDHGHNTTR